MRAKSNPAATIGILSLLGLVAALVSILVPALLTAPRSPLFVGGSLGIFPGDIFGVMISVYFWAYAGIRSVTKAIGLVVASTFAYFVAMYSGVILGMFLSAAMGYTYDTESAELGPAMVAPLLIAGVLGAFLVLIAVLRLYSAETSWRSVMIKASPGSLFGGLFALVGWGLGPSLGKTVWLGLQSHQLTLVNEDMQYAVRSGTLNNYSVHIIWQAGMGIVLGILFSQSRPAHVAVSTIAIPGRKLQPSNAFLLALMAVPLAFFFILSLPDNYQNMRWHRVHRKELAEGPPSNIPKMDTTPAAAMLILTPIGKYQPESARAEHSPIEQVYSVRYSLSGTPSVSPTNLEPHVDVVVQDWPPRWAKTEVERQDQGFSKIAHENANGATVEERAKFGSRVLFKRDAGTHYAWISNTRIILVRSYSADPDEILKRYLGKYPSTP